MLVMLENRQSALFTKKQGLFFRRGPVRQRPFPAADKTVAATDVMGREKIIMFFHFPPCRRSVRSSSVTCDQNLLDCAMCEMHSETIAPSQSSSNSLLHPRTCEMAASGRSNVAFLPRVKITCESRFHVHGTWHWRKFFPPFFNRQRRAATAMPNTIISRARLSIGPTAQIEH